ncbi:MAG: DUF427 domain-containing protein [Actinoallomurus sp.]
MSLTLPGAPLSGRPAGVFNGDVTAPRLLETGLPVRYYPPREDIRLDLLQPSDTVTRCAYKGQARCRSGLFGAGAEQAAKHLNGR